MPCSSLTSLLRKLPPAAIGIFTLASHRGERLQSWSTRGVAPRDTRTSPSYRLRQAKARGAGWRSTAPNQAAARKPGSSQAPKAPSNQPGSGEGSRRLVLHKAFSDSSARAATLAGQGIAGSCLEREPHQTPSYGERRTCAAARRPPPPRRWPRRPASPSRNARRRRRRCLRRPSPAAAVFARLRAHVGAGPDEALLVERDAAAHEPARSGIRAGEEEQVGDLVLVLGSRAPVAAPDAMQTVVRRAEELDDLGIEEYRDVR